MDSQNRMLKHGLKISTFFFIGMCTWCLNERVPGLERTYLLKCLVERAVGDLFWWWREPRWDLPKASSVTVWFGQSLNRKRVYDGDAWIESCFSLGEVNRKVHYWDLIYEKNLRVLKVWECWRVWEYWKVWVLEDFYDFFCLTKIWTLSLSMVSLFIEKGLGV